MDPSLLAQRKAFQAHAARTMSVQQRPQVFTNMLTFIIYQFQQSDNSHSTYNAEVAKKKKKTVSNHAGMKSICLQDGFNINFRQSW